MTKNPVINACLASLYIMAVSLVMYYGTRSIGGKETIFIPIAILSLFVLSAAVMGYLFLYQPIRLYFDGDKRVAIKLFLLTVAVFAGITTLIFLCLFFGII